MTIEFQGHSRVVFTVKLYEDCLAFYRDTVPLSIINQWNRAENDKGIVYQLGQIELELLKGDKNSTLDDGTYLYVQVKDVNQLYEEIKDKVDIITPIASQEWGHRNFTIQDPAGVKLKFFSLV